MYHQVSVALTAAIVAAGCSTAMPRATPQAPTHSAPRASVPAIPATRSDSNVIPALGLVTANTVNVTATVDGRLMSIVDGRPVEAGQLLATIESPQSRAELSSGGDPSPENRTGRLVDTRIKAPISGLAGLRKVDPLNCVRAGETLLTITQLRPIAVVFPVAQDYLPRVRALLRKGATPVVEAFDRTGTALLATGHLVAIDNEIDEQSGTIKLKANFENADGELFPNQFVNVRLLLGPREAQRH